MKDDLLIRITVFKVYLIYTLYFIGRLFISKRRKRLLFIPSHQLGTFEGNLKVFCNYVNDSHSDFQCYVYLAGDKKNRDFSTMDNRYIIFRSQVRLIWEFLKAEHIIIDGTNPYLISKHMSVIQLWHGCGLKNVGLDNQNTDKQLMKLFKKHFKAYRLVTALSEFDRLKHNSNFNITTAKITGIARNDLFFKSQSDIEEIKHKHGLLKFDRIITYAPTFRDNYTVDNFSKEFWTELNSQLSKENDVLLIKKHPWDRFFDVPQKLTNIVDLSPTVKDVQELLIITDLLISDYSSIVTDFAITKRPVLYYFFDHELYLEKCRSMSDDIEDILPGPFIYNEMDLLFYLKDNKWMESADLKNKVEAFKIKFHKYLDGRSSERIFNAMINLNKSTT